MIRLSLSICLFLGLFSFSLAGLCGEAKMCCKSRAANCKPSRLSDNGIEGESCFCDFSCVENNDCCEGFLEDCGLDARPNRFLRGLFKREAKPEITNDKAASLDTKEDGKDDSDDYINEEGYDEEFMNDDDDDADEDANDDEDNDEDLDNANTQPLVMISQPTNITIGEGKSVWLHCAVENGEGVVIWMKGEKLLYQNGMITEDKQYFIYKNNTLAITDLSRTDYGAYICRVIDGLGKEHSVMHRLIAPQAPRVVQVLPMDRERNVPEGKPLKIQCLVTGEPKPKITWSREGSRLTDEIARFEDHTLYIKSVSRQDSGKYQCLATNGVGTPAVGKVTIKVLHAPEVHVKKTVVNTDEGYEATLLCSVKSNSRSAITWEKNSELIHDSHHHHIVMDNERTHSTLRILKVTANDFGKYTCRARNEFGEGEGHVILVKQPGRAMWVSGEQDNNDAPVLQWAVDSVQPITDIELRYLKVDQSKPNVTATEEEWIVVKPDIAQPNGNVYTVKHALNGLAPGKYAAQIRAKNTHGWSVLSEQHFFDGAFDSNDVLESDPDDYAPAVAGIRTATGSATSLEISSTTTVLLSAVTYVLVRIL